MTAAAHFVGACIEVDRRVASSLARAVGEAESCTVEVVGAVRHAYASTYPAMVVTCRCPDGSRRLVHVKQGDMSAETASRVGAHGHRGALDAEARAYRDLVAPTGLSAPRLYGAHQDANGATWLFIEHLEGAVELDEASIPEDALVDAARWIGTFQRWHEHAASKTDLMAYGVAYYRGWLDRTIEYAGPWPGRLPRLGDLRTTCEPLLLELSEISASVIHGELTPSNVLVRGEDVYPVDWQSAAVGLGEIDVVALLDKWPTEVVERAGDAYVKVRYPESPADSARRFDLARLYWDLRWLGDRPEWTALDKVGPRFEHLLAVVARLTEMNP